MKKSYKIEVDCANCANKMEKAAKDFDFILAAKYRDELLKLKANK